jgi:hypothetical protein
MWIRPISLECKVKGKFKGPRFGRRPEEKAAQTIKVEVNNFYKKIRPVRIDFQPTIPYAPLRLKSATREKWN